MTYTTMKPLVSYPNADAMKADYIHTKEYLSLPAERRVSRLQAVETEYNRRIVEQNQKKLEEETGPDAIGQLNEMLGKRLDKEFGPNVGAWGRALLPQSNSQAMMDAVQGATMFAPGVPEIEAIGGIARLGLRVGIPAVAGAVGGSIQGGAKGAEMGFGSGLAQGLGGEAISAVAGLGRRGVKAISFAPLKGWIESRLPGTVVKDVPSFNRAFMGGEAIETARQRLAAINSKIAKKVLPKMNLNAAGSTLDINPNVASQLSKNVGYSPSGQLVSQFHNLNHALDELENLGWHSKKFGQDEEGKAIRSAAHQVEGEIAKQLGNISPKSAVEWYNAKGQLRAAKTLTHMFTEPGVVAEDKIHWPKLQELVSDATAKGYKMDLQQSLGDKEYKTLSQVVKGDATVAGKNAQSELSGVLHRGAQEGRQDIEGVSPIHRAYTHPSLENPLQTRLGLGISMPVFARHVGYVPYDLGKGKAIQALTTLGPYQTALAIHSFVKSQPQAKALDGKETGPLLPPTSVVPDKGSDKTSAGAPPEPPPIIPGAHETGVSPSGVPTMTMDPIK
jgi:hypothetical protein